MSVEGRDDTQQYPKCKSGLFCRRLGSTEVVLSELCDSYISGGFFSYPREGTKFLRLSSQTTVKQDYLQEQCQEIGERPDNKLQKCDEL